MNRRSFLKRFVATAAGLAAGASAAEVMERLVNAPAPPTVPIQPTPEQYESGASDEYMAVIDAQTGSVRSVGRVVRIERNTITIDFAPAPQRGDYLVLTTREPA